MKIEKLCVRRQIEDVAGATTHGHKIAIKGGYIHQAFQGGYTYSPLGCRVLQNIEKIIREEMNAVGGQEILMPVVSGAELWRLSGRYDSAAESLGLVKFKGRGGADYLLNATHEEAVVDFVKTVLESYRQMPFMVYQIQTKYRDELRARAGTLRTREFRMKDGYSFHETQEDLEKYYAQCLSAYYKLFKRCGFINIIHVESPTGGMGGTLAHEFQLIHKNGEDTVYLCDCGFNMNNELVENGEEGICPKCGAKMRKERGIEIGNIFQLGTKYSESMNLTYTDANGKQGHPIMGCYGIGTTRVFGALLEESADEKGPVWNMETAPFAVEVIGLADKTGKTFELAQEIHDMLDGAGIEVLLDNRDVRAGEKFADADLIAAPIRLIVSEKNLAENFIEVKYRVNKNTDKLPTKFSPENYLMEVIETIIKLKH